MLQDFCKPTYLRVTLRCVNAGYDAEEPILNGHKRAPVSYHDDDGYIVPYDVMLGVLAHSPQPLLRESTLL